MNDQRTNHAEALAAWLPAMLADPEAVAGARSAMADAMRDYFTDGVVQALLADVAPDADDTLRGRDAARVAGIDVWADGFPWDAVAARLWAEHPVVAAVHAAVAQARDEGGTA